MSILNIKKITAAGAVFTASAGTLLHFVFQWSSRSPVAAVFSPVNESTCEHLKLIFIPMFFYGVFEFFAYGHKRDDFIPARAVSILIGMLVIVSFFYTYTGILGKNFLPLDIAVFLLGTAAAYSSGYKFIKEDMLSSPRGKIVGWAVLVMLVFSFGLFTFYPPKIGLLLDPVTGGYSF